MSSRDNERWRVRAAVSALDLATALSGRPMGLRSLASLCLNEPWGAVLFLHRRKDGGFHGLYACAHLSDGVWSVIEEEDDAWTVAGVPTTLALAPVFTSSFRGEPFTVVGGTAPRASHVVVEAGDTQVVGSVLEMAAFIVILGGAPRTLRIVSFRDSQALEDERIDLVGTDNEGERRY